MQSADEPVMVPADGSGDTVIYAVAMAIPQPLVTVYDIIAVPAAIPVTTPDVSTLAVAALLVLQVPPVTVSTIVLVADSQTDVEPVMKPSYGVVTTATAMVEVAVPHEELTE
jgi:hypothetical protein